LVASLGLASLAASGLAIESVLGASALSFAGVAAGADVAAGVALGAGVSVAQETSPADKPRLATIKRAFKFIVVIIFCLVRDLRDLNASNYM
jgi:hypothetical protein